MNIKKSAVIAGAAGLAAVTAMCVFAKNSEVDSCREFLSRYGWEVNGSPCETEKVYIPAEFDNIYENYNVLQLDAGLDLKPCRGKNGTRYTFEVTNYPYDAGEKVYADVIVIDGKPAGGDIKTNSMAGFMHSLRMRGQ